MSSLSCLHTSCRGYLIPGSTRLIVQYCKHVISRSTASDDLFVDKTLIVTQSLTEENSALSQNEDVQEIEDPILVAVNAGVLQQVLLSHVSENFLPTKGSTSKGGVVKVLSGQVPGIGSQSTQNIILLWLTGNCSAMLEAKLSLRRKVQLKNISNPRSTREACPRLQKANRRARQ